MHRSMWNLPGPQIEPVSPELVGSFLSTVAPGSPLYMLFVPSKKGSNDFLLHTSMKISSVTSLVYPFALWQGVWGSQFPVPGLNPCPLQWSSESQPRDHQGIPHGTSCFRGGNRGRPKQNFSPAIATCIALLVNLI